MGTDQELQARVEDLEACLAEVCELIAKKRTELQMFGTRPTADDIWDVLLHVLATIKTHQLGA